MLVVSHDSESAQKYADRIIEIKDGKIVSDSAPEVGEDKTKADGGIKSHLPTALSLRMGWRNFGKKKIRSAMTFIVAILAMTVLAFAEVFASFTAERSISESIVKNNLDYITLGQFNTEPNSHISNNNGGLLPFDFDNGFRNELKGLSYLEAMTQTIVRDNRAYIVEEAAQLEKMGIELYDGAVELTDKNVYATDYLITNMKRDAVDSSSRVLYGVREGDKVIPIDDERYNYQTLVGKKICISGWGEIELAGIVKTDYESYDEYVSIDPDTGEIIDLSKRPSINDWAKYKLFEETKGFRSDSLYNAIYCTRDFYMRLIPAYNPSYSFYGNNDETYIFQNVSVGNRVTFYNNSLNNSLSGIYMPVLLSGVDTCVNSKNISLNNADEIIISAGLYNQMFDNEIVQEEFVSESYDDKWETVYTVKKYPKHLGDTIRFTVRRDKKVISEKTFKITGVVMGSRYGISVDSNYVILGNDGMAEVMDEILCTGQVLLNVQGLRAGTVRRLLNALRNEHGVGTYSPYSETIYKNELLQRVLGYAFLTIGVIMIIVTLLVVVSLISYNIIAQRKEIGILRALGARASDIAKIYFCQAAILSAVVFVVSTVLSAVLIFLLNTLLAKVIIAGLVTVGYTVFTWLILTFGTFGAMFLSTSLPLRKISRQKPAEAIKKG